MKRITIALIILIVFAVLTGCVWEPPPYVPPPYEPPAPSPPVDYSKAITYEVRGTAAKIGCITIENKSGGTSQYTNIIPPWTMELSMYEGAFVYVSAQNGTATGTVIVTIYVDDRVFKTSTSSGAYVIASAYGILP